MIFTDKGFENQKNDWIGLKKYECINEKIHFVIKSTYKMQDN